MKKSPPPLNTMYEILYPKVVVMHVLAHKIIKVKKKRPIARFLIPNSKYISSRSSDNPTYPSRSTISSFYHLIISHFIQLLISYLGPGFLTCMWFSYKHNGSLTGSIMNLIVFIEHCSFIYILWHNFELLISCLNS